MVATLLFWWLPKKGTHRHTGFTHDNKTINKNDDFWHQKWSVWDTALFFLFLSLSSLFPLPFLSLSSPFPFPLPFLSLSCPFFLSFFLSFFVSFSVPFPFVFLSFSFRFTFSFPFLFLSLSFSFLFPFPLRFLFFPFPSFATIPFLFPSPRSCEFFDQGVKPALGKTIRGKTTITFGKTIWKVSGFLQPPTFFLAFYLAHILTFILFGILFSILSDPHFHNFWHSIWHLFWHSIWHTFWHSTWHSIWHLCWHSTCHMFWHSICFFSGILSEILSGIVSGILFGMCSGPGMAHGIRSWRYGVQVQAWPTASGAGDMVFGPRRGPQHPELAIMARRRRWTRTKKEHEQRKKRKEEENEELSFLNLETLTWQEGEKMLDSCGFALGLYTPKVAQCRWKLCPCTRTNGNQPENGSCLLCVVALLRMFSCSLGLLRTTTKVE